MELSFAFEGAAAEELPQQRRGLLCRSLFIRQEFFGYLWVVLLRTIYPVASSRDVAVKESAICEAHMV